MQARAGWPWAAPKLRSSFPSGLWGSGALRPTGRLVPASRTRLSPSRSLGRGQWQAPRDSPPRLWSEWAHSPAGGKSSSVVGRRSSGGGRAGRTWFLQDGAPSPGPHRWAAAGLSPPPCSPVSSLPPRVQDRGHLHPRSQGLWGRVGERGRPAAVGGAVLAPLPEGPAPPAASWPCGGL